MSMPVEALQALQLLQRHDDEAPGLTFKGDSDPRFPWLCFACRGIFDQWKKLDDARENSFKPLDAIKFDYHNNYSDWFEAATDNCAICAGMVNDLRKEFLHQFDSLRHDDLTKNLGNERQKEELELRLVYTKKSQDVSLQLKVRFLHAPHIWKLKQVTQIPRSPLPLLNSHSSLPQAKRWLADCMKNHPECSAATHPYEAPTRLLDLSDESVRLLETSTTTFDHAYATLSHCWGTIDIFKLKNENIDALKRRMSVESLPKTFQDAIVVTRTLGLKYLWIDSLCIIQNDEKDWEIEASKMSFVYGSATINIAATYAKDGSFGLFGDRDISRVIRRHVKTKAGLVYELPDFESDANSAGDIYERCLTEAPLNRRAWVFQERYLAQRTLHFSAEQIFFQCQHHMVCETWPSGYPDFSRKNPEKMYPKKLKFQDWSHIVWHYSRGQLTFHKDKLIAVAGVVRLLQSTAESTYVAGMWTSQQLERQLFWCVDPSEQLVAKPETRRAPTWSWASTDYPIDWWLEKVIEPVPEEELPNTLLKILNIDLHRTSPSIFGPVDSAILTIQCGPCLRLEAMAENFNDPLLQGSFSYDYEDNSSTADRFMLPILEEVVTSTRSNMMGLIITPTARNGVFERCGLCDIGFVERYLKYIVALPERLMDESLYEGILEPNEHGVPQYTIELA